MEPKRCEGFKQTGYWKGNPCGADGKYERGGRFYCANHMPEVMAAREVSGKKTARKLPRRRLGEGQNAAVGDPEGRLCPPGTNPSGLSEIGGNGGAGELERMLLDGTKAV